jgi:hypothetical protein
MNRRGRAGLIRRLLVFVVGLAVVLASSLVFTPEAAMGAGGEASATDFSPDTNLPSGMISATVGAHPANPPYDRELSGTIEVTEGSRSLGTCAAENGPGDPGPIEVVSVGPLTAGRHTLTATYSGDATFAPSAAVATIDVLARSVRTHLSMEHSYFTVPEGTPVRFHAWTEILQPTSSPPLPEIPPSQMRFLVDGALGATIPSTQGRATWETELAPGRHRVAAVYLEDGYYRAIGPSNDVEVFVVHEPAGSTSAPTAPAGAVGSTSPTGTSGSSATAARSGLSEPGKQAASPSDTRSSAEKDRSASARLGRGSSDLALISPESEESPSDNGTVVVLALVAALVAPLVVAGFVWARRRTRGARTAKGS